MRVLLSGGAGFIGSHVAEALLGRHHEVAIVDDLSSGKRENIPEGAHLYEADIRSGCEEVFEGFEPEALCHQAAQMDVRRSVKEPYFDADVNVLGTIRLLQACVEYRVGKVVFASTGGAVYGEHRGSRQLKTTRSIRSPPTVSPSSRASATSTTTTPSTACNTLPCATQTSLVPGRTHTVKQGSLRSSRVTWPRAESRP
jgi:nucleoside-diphosphate-sugar epimerase